MNNMFGVVKERTIGDAYESLVRLCLKEGIELDTDRPIEFGDKSLALNMVTVIVTEPFAEPMKSDRSLRISTRKYAEEYAMRYLILGNKEKDEPYTYGEQLHKNDQMNKCIKQMIEYPDRRDHVMSVGEPDLFGIDDPPCLREIGFRKYDNNKILMWAIFRSWDVYGASNDNILGLARLGEHMLLEVNIARMSSGLEQLQLTPLVIYGVDAHIYTRPQSPGYFKHILKEFAHNPVGNQND